MKVQEIKAKAKTLGINPGKMNKMELIRSIQAQEGNFPCFQTATTNTCDQTSCCWRNDCLTTH